MPVPSQATRHAEMEAIDHILNDDSLPRHIPDWRRGPSPSHPAPPLHAVDQSTQAARAAAAAMVAAPAGLAAPDASEQVGGSAGASNSCQRLELIRRSTLYVTCEPCIMCASALAQVSVHLLRRISISTGIAKHRPFSVNPGVLIVMIRSRGRYPRLHVLPPPAHRSRCA
jgi:hypothetical protein